MILTNGIKCQSKGKNVKIVKNKQKQNGYTLVEAIIAIAIIAIIAAIFTNIIAVSLNARNLSKQRLQVLATATSKLDEIVASKSSWKTVAGMKQWLINNGFNLNGTIYHKQETNVNNISCDLNISILENTGISGLFQLNLNASAASGGKTLVLVLRLREAD